MQGFVSSEAQLGDRPWPSCSEFRALPKTPPCPISGVCSHLQELEPSGWDWNMVGRGPWQGGLAGCGTLESGLQEELGMFSLL